MWAWGVEVGVYEALEFWALRFPGLELSTFRISEFHDLLSSVVAFVLFVSKMPKEKIKGQSGPVR